MKPIPFNLERCIAGDEVMTRDGHDFVFGAYNEKMRYSLLGWVNGVSASRLANGMVDNCETHLDLFMKPEKITRWVYVHRYCGFSTKELAVQQIEEVHRDITVSKDAVSLIKIEFSPGEGLND